MKYILALDQGTTSSRAVVLGHDGHVHGLAQAPFRQIYPKPGWVEHDPREIWSTQFGVAMDALAQSQGSARTLAAIGITNQRETTILWDNRKTGEPVYNAIVWQEGARRDFVINYARKDTRKRSNRKPASSSTPISPPARFVGFSTTCRARVSGRSVESWPSEQSIAGWFGI